MDYAKSVPKMRLEISNFLRNLSTIKMSDESYRVHVKRQQLTSI